MDLAPAMEGSGTDVMVRTVGVITVGVEEAELAVDAVAEVGEGVEAVAEASRLNGEMNQATYESEICITYQNFDGHEQ